MFGKKRNRRRRKRQVYRSENNDKRITDYFIFLKTWKRVFCLVIIPAVIISIFFIILGFDTSGNGSIYCLGDTIIYSYWRLFLELVKIFGLFTFALYIIWMLIDFTQAIPRSIFHESPKERVFSILLLLGLIIRALYQFFN